MDRGHGQLGPGVECARSLAGVPGTDEVELASGDDPFDEPIGFGLDTGLVLAVGFLLPLLSDQTSQHHGLLRPSLGRFHGTEVVGGALDLVRSAPDFDWFLLGGFLFYLFGFLGFFLAFLRIFGSRGRDLFLAESSE